MNKVKIYFSDFFSVEKDIIEEYGAVDISLINDLPLFIDPFLLFNSEDEEYQKIHQEIIRYIFFLQEQSELFPNLSKGMKDAWFSFSEIKQTWLGFSSSGNSGRGMGTEFAKNLFTELNTMFKDFQEKKVTRGHHLEKLCLISPRIGRDKISDFTTNFVKKYLLEYTQNFAKLYLPKEKCNTFNINRVYFNWDTKTWASKFYFLPRHEGDFVLLTPKSMLTRDDTFINRVDMIRNLEKISPAIPDAALRFQLDTYFTEVLSKKKKEMSRQQKNKAAEELIRKYPELIDYYIKFKEDKKEEATSISIEKVREVEQLFIKQLPKFISILQQETKFYQVPPDAHIEAKKRVQFLKHVIEDQDGYRLFYIDGNPIKRELDLQIMFRLIWYGTELDVNREVNNGRGPVDYKISFGKKNSTLVEFKLASNTKLKDNLAKQVDIYKAASETDRSIKVVLFFTAKEEERVISILKELKMYANDDIVLIDARNDNKISASNVKIE